jgi:hypothetical protein
MNGTFLSAAGKVALYALALGVTISACAQLGRSGTDTWKEEVLLHDGQRIVVERLQTYGGRHEVGQGPPIREHTIRFVLPGSGESVAWTSGYDQDLGRTDFNLLALHISQGTPYLVAKPNLCLSYNKWGRPNPPYVIFRYERDSGWRRIPFNELPPEFETVNLVIDSVADARILMTQRVITAERVKELNDQLTQPEHKKILRQPLKEGSSGIVSCEELVRYKCGWGAPGEFNRKYFESACK